MPTWPINDLALRAAAGDELAFARLERQLRHKLKAISHHYFAPGLDRDDVRQEALIALHTAVTSWDSARTASFTTFAGMVINRRLMDMVTAARRLKHEALNGSYSLHHPMGDAEECLVDVLVGSYDTARVAQGRGDLKLLAEPGWLSPLEAQALAICAEHHGRSGQLADAAARIGVPLKKVDNALQRARAKAAARLAA